MIVVEEKLQAIFDMLPSMSYSEQSDVYKPVFAFGDKVQLAAFLKEAETNNSSPYPLIWFLYPSLEDHNTRSKKVKVEDLTLILAVNASKVHLNKTRLETTFKKILIPLYENVEHALKVASNTNLDPDVKVIKFPNYSSDSGENNFTNETWDALKTVWKLTISDICLKEIKFKS